MIMTQITEDYVSFEVAKLLKEKGFDIPCSCFGSWNGVNLTYRFHRTNKTTNWNKHTYTTIISLPTLSLACKWLRVRHNLNVEVYRTACGYIGCIVAVPSGTDIKFLEDDGDDKASGQYTDPELAYEAAIKYCLEHLI